VFHSPAHAHVNTRTNNLNLQTMSHLEAVLLITNHKIMNKRIASHITTLTRMRKHGNLDQATRQPDQDMNLIPLLTQPAQYKQHQQGTKCTSSQPCSHNQL
jgi:hypothetical protein